MSGKMSRNKGQRGEREFIAVMQECIDTVLGEGVFKIKRNLEQYQNGGCDITGLPQALDFISVEIKFQETFCLNAWWNQTVAQARENQIPVLAYRKSRVKWRVRMLAPIWLVNNVINEPATMCIDVSVDDFKNWYICNLADSFKEV